jgi:hypothetical protein
MITRLCLLCALVGLPRLESAAPAAGYDFFVGASITRNYVIGSKIVTINGVFRRDAAGEWQHIGYNDTGISAFAFDPRNRDVIYTSALNGLWRSLDGGKLWRICNDSEMSEGLDVAVDPNAPDHVYLALPDGVAFSSDRAQTLERREKGLPARGKFTRVLAIDRTRAGRVFAGCEIGIYLTEDAGKNWRQVLPTEETVADVQQSPHDPQLWLAVTQSAGAWRSADGGLNWVRLPGMPGDHPLYNVTFDVTNPRRLAIGSWGRGVWTSEDGGGIWTDRNAGLPAPARVWRVGVDPEGQLYASVVGQALYKSPDFGRTWRTEGLAGSAVRRFVLLPRSPK